MPHKLNTLAIDVGTHAMRAAIYCSQDQHLTTDRIVEVPLTLNDFGSGHIEQDPAEFIRGIEYLLAELAPAINKPCHIALACQRSSVLAWNASDHRAISPILSWQDTRAATRVHALTPNQQEFIHRRTGLPINAHFGASKIATLAENYHTEKALMYGPLAAWLVHYLTGQPLCDLVNACRTLCVDIHALPMPHWHHDLCSIWGINPQQLPRIAPCKYDFGDVHIKHKNLGTLKVVTGDQNAAVIALQNQGKQAGFNKPLIVNIGSGAFILGAIAKPLRSNSSLLTAPLFAEASCIDWVQEGTVNSAGTELTRWREANCEMSESALFQQLPAWLAAGDDDIPLYLPTTAGLGSPFWASRFKKARSQFFTLEGEPCTTGITQQATAVVESIAFLIAANIAAMQDTNKRYDGIIFAGGLSRLTGLTERVCQLAGLQGWVSDEFEATLLGAAIACRPQNNKASIKGRIVAANNTTPLLKNRYQRYIALIRNQQI